VLLAAIPEYQTCSAQYALVLQGWHASSHFGTPLWCCCSQQLAQQLGHVDSTPARDGTASQAAAKRARPLSQQRQRQGPWAPAQGQQQGAWAAQRSASSKAPGHSAAPAAGRLGTAQRQQQGPWAPAQHQHQAGTKQCWRQSSSPSVEAHDGIAPVHRDCLARDVGGRWTDQEGHQPCAWAPVGQSASQAASQSAR
jgi:hypothetical protein